MTAGTGTDTESAVWVASKRLVADGVLAIEFEAADGGDLPQWQPGAHVDVLIEGVMTRQYSLCGDPDDRSTYRIGVLRDAQGSGSSTYLHDRLVEGERLRIRGPRNHFPLREAPAYRFVAGGIGITPILPMIKAAQGAGADWQLLYGGRCRNSMAFLEELAADEGRVQICPQDEIGLLDLDTYLGQPAPRALVYCCGPEPLLAAVTARCASWPHGSLELERFSAKPVDEPVLVTAFEVVLAQSGKTVIVPPEQSILESVRAAGVTKTSSCEEGMCGTCETTVLEGTVDHRDSLLDEDEQAANDTMMICVSRAACPRLVLDL